MGTATSRAFLHSPYTTSLRVHAIRANAVDARDGSWGVIKIFSVAAKQRHSLYMYLRYHRGIVTGLLKRYVCVICAPPKMYLASHASGPTSLGGLARRLLPRPKTKETYPRSPPPWRPDPARSYGPPQPRCCSWWKVVPLPSDAASPHR